MSTATTSRTAPAAAAPVPSDARVTALHLVRSEWIKLWSLRSTYWTIAATIGVLALLGLAMAATIGMMPAEAGVQVTEGGADTVYLTLSPGQVFGSLVLVVLAALAITGEYGTGQVRSTFAADPRRLGVLWAKGTVVMVVTFATAAVGTALSLVIAGAVSSAARPDWSDPEMLRVVLGTPLYIATVALLGFAVGALLRNTAASIATVIGFVLVLESILNLISWKPMEYVRPFLPASAGARLTAPESMLEMSDSTATVAVQLSPWGGYAVLVAWVVVILAAAAVRLRTRDV